LADSLKYVGDTRVCVIIPSDVNYVKSVVNGMSEGKVT